MSRASRRQPQLSQAQAAEALAVSNSGPPGPWATHAVGRINSRLPRASLAGPAGEPSSAARALLPTGGSQGNAGLIRGAPTAGPGYCGGRHDGAYYPIPEPDGSKNPRNYNTQSRTGPAFHNGSTIVYDRHVMAKSGTEMQQAHPDSTGGQGLSPLADGPVRPVYMLVHRVMAPRYGNTATRHLDNPGPFATTTDSHDRPQPLGTQDGSPYSPQYGGTPGLTHVYGVRGTTGVVSPAEPGGPGDGPQKIRGGPAHGLHSRSQPDAELLRQRRRATPQQQRTRRSLPLNSARSGQAWSQNAQRLGGPAVTVPAAPARPLPGQAGRRLGR